MSESVFWSIVMQALPYQVPVFILWVTGIILSIYFRRQNQKKFTMLLVAFTIFLLISTVSIYINALLTDELLSHNITMSQRVAYSDALSCITTPLDIVGWVILLIAIFSRKLNPIAQSA